MSYISLLQLSANQACMIIYKYVYIEHAKKYCYKIITIITINMAIYNISSICFIIMNQRSSIKSPKRKMLDDRVHNMFMSLNLNKFLLSLSTHQDLFKLL